MKKSLKKRNLENKITIFFQKPPQFGEHSNEPFQNQHTIIFPIFSAQTHLFLPIKQEKLHQMMNCMLILKRFIGMFPRFWRFLNKFSDFFSNYFFFKLFFILQRFFSEISGKNVLNPGIRTF